MSNWRTRVLQRLNPIYCSTVVCTLIFIVAGSTELAKSQVRSTLPGPTMREGNRTADDYDRAINRMKNDARAANERRRSLFPQIDEDFQRIQVIHNEMVRMLQSDKGLNYERLSGLADDMKKRSARLRTNLALPSPEKTEEKATHPADIDDKHVKTTIGDLHERIVSFVANPMFKNLGVVDAKAIDAASEDLEEIIDFSDEIKREAKLLSKPTKK